jgi:hypothetical protein
MMLFLVCLLFGIFLEGAHHRDLVCLSAAEISTTKSVLVSCSIQTKGPTSLVATC